MDNSKSQSDGQALPERQFRWHPLLQQWVIVSAASSKRPWSGAVSEGQVLEAPVHDPACYLCPGVTRSTGEVNPDYKGAFAFTNDFPAITGDHWQAPDVLSGQATVGEAATELRASAGTAGICRVLCWSERHNATLGDLSAEEMLGVAKLWQNEHKTLSSNDVIAQVVIFENKGVEIGVSNLHPHGQIYALPFVSETASRMRRAQASYALKHSRSLFGDLVQREEYLPGDNSLLVEQGKHFKTVVPYFARFAFETWIVPLTPVNFIHELNDEQLADLAMLYQRQCKRYDRLFQRAAPNITQLHNAPCNDHEDNQHCCFHIAFQPPLRAPGLMKFLAGFEATAGNIVNPVIPEIAAGQLRDCDSDRNV